MDSSVEIALPSPCGFDNFAELRKNLPREAMEPSAPMYIIEPTEENEPRREQMSLLRTAPDDTAESLEMMQAELDLKKAKLKKEKLEKEKQFIVEDFTNRIEHVDTEIAVALAKMQSLKESFKQPRSTAQLEPPPGSVNGHIHLPSPQRGDGGRASVSPARGGTSAAMMRPPVLNNAAPSSLGIEQLRVLDCVVVKQLLTEGMAETYEVIAPVEGLVIFHVIVQVGVVNRERIVRVKFIDGEANEAMVFRVKQDGSELHIGGKLTCIVTRPHTFFKSKLIIHDRFQKPVLKIKATNSAADGNAFLLQTNNKNVIGKITKKVVQITQSHGPSYSVLQFPLDLDVCYKAAFLACNFVIVEDYIIAMRNQKFESSVALMQQSMHQQAVRQYPTERH